MQKERKEKRKGLKGKEYKTKRTNKSMMMESIAKFSKPFQTIQKQTKRL